MDVHSGSPPGPAALNFSVCVSGVRGFARYKDGPTSLVASAEHELAAEARCRQIRNGQVPRSRRMCAISHASLTHVRCVDDFSCALHRASSVNRSARMEGGALAQAKRTAPQCTSIIASPRPSPFRLLAQARRERARGRCPHGEGRRRRRSRSRSRSWRNEGPFRPCHESPSAHQHAR